jgi:hypothetical protein
LYMHCEKNANVCFVDLAIGEGLAGSGSAG